MIGVYKGAGDSRVRLSRQQMAVGGNVRRARTAFTSMSGSSKREQPNDSTHNHSNQCGIRTAFSFDAG